MVLKAAIANVGLWVVGCGVVGCCLTVRVAGGEAVVGGRLWWEE